MFVCDAWEHIPIYTKAAMKTMLTKLFGDNKKAYKGVLALIHRLDLRPSDDLFQLLKQYNELQNSGCTTMHSLLRLQAC